MRNDFATMLAPREMTLNKMASNDHDPIAAQALKRREEAIERLNLCASPTLPVEANSIGNQEIVVYPQSASGGIFAIMLFSMVLIPGQIWISTDSLFQQFVLPALFFLLSLWAFAYLFLQPSEISIREREQTVSVSFRLGWLIKRSRVHQFADFKSIQSTFKLTGDNDAQVSLELILKTNERYVLKTLPPDWPSLSPQIGFSGCIEPKAISTLRLQVAALTGIENLGFVR